MTYDLVNFELVEKANVTDAGIIVMHKPAASNNDATEMIKSIIRMEHDLDNLKKAINDVARDL